MMPHKIILFIVGLVEILAVIGCLLYAEYSNNENIESFFDLWPIWGSALVIGSFIQLVIMYPLEKGD